MLSKPAELLLIITFMVVLLHQFPEGEETPGKQLKGLQSSVRRYMLPKCKMQSSKMDYVAFHVHLVTGIQAWRESMGLSYHAEFKTDTTLATIYAQVTTAMELHAFSYEFEVVEPGSNILRFLPDYNQHFQPLQYVNAGKVDSGGHRRLRAAPHNSTTTLTTIIQDTRMTAFPFCIEQSQNLAHLVFNICFKRQVKATYLLRATGLGESDIVQLHLCMGDAFYQAYWFHYDSEFMITQAQGQVEEDCDCEDPNQALEDQENTATTNDPGFTLPSVLRGLPVQNIWATAFEESELNMNYIPLLNDTLTRQILQAAVPNNNLFLCLTAPSMPLLVSALKDLILSCVTSRDCSLLLSPRRHFTIVSDSCAAATMAWFFKLLYNERGALLPSLPMRSARAISEQRLTEVRVFGAATGLMMLHGKTPEPFAEMYIRFMFYDRDIRCLTEAVVREYAPELRTAMRTLIAAGPNGDISTLNRYFQSYMDTDVHTFSTRGPIAHDSLASELLYACVIGTQPPMHPEIVAFCEGFSLGCPGGFTLPSVIMQRYPTGVNGFLNFCSLSKIAGFATLEAHLSFETNHRPEGADLQAVVAGYVSAQTFSLEMFIGDFLKGSGIPIPSLWDTAVHIFAEGLPLEDIDEASFRSKIFAWAVTGCPELKSSIVSCEDPIAIILCEPSNVQYGDSSIDITGSLALAKRGQLAMHTCFNTILIPALYFKIAAEEITEALGADVPVQARQEGLRKQLEHWFLVELLNGIGKHSIL
ncbi:hypothetical protein C8J56DRAFT_906240 [Mycena floridula]|nr:hypothetical protein C8J56DRAFT_906240 [Mycena floridula]